MAFYDHAINAVRGIYDRRIHTPPVLDAAHFFPGAERFLERWIEIRREALSIAKSMPSIPQFHDLAPNQIEVATDDGRDWRMFIMKAYGISVEKNLERCPTVANLLDQNPEVVSAVFSFLAPGKHIPAHRGPFRAILRFHLMLSMPEDKNGVPACELRIDGVPYRLKTGEGLLWDDTFPHEVWNRSNQVRIALLLDIWRRDMPADLALMSRALLNATKVWVLARGVSYAGIGGGIGGERPNRIVDSPSLIFTQESEKNAWTAIDHIRAKIGKVSGDSTSDIREDRDGSGRYQ